MPSLWSFEDLSNKLRYECLVVDEWARIYGYSWWRKGSQKVLTSKSFLEYLKRPRARRADTASKLLSCYSKSASHPAILHLYSSNDPPNDEQELDWILAEIRARESILRIHHQNLPHKRVLSESASSVLGSHLPEIVQLEQQISQLKSLLSPLRRLPAELLQEIFLIGAPEHITHNFASSDFPHGELVWSWTVAAVCRKWRDVALSTPELWNVLPHLTFERVNFHHHKMQYSKFDFILRCSGNLPLHVYIEARTPWLPEKCAVLDLLIQHSERWETVVIKMTSSAFSYLNGVKSRIPRLQRLSLTLWHSWAHNEGVDWDMFAVAPRLIDVSLKCRSPVGLRLPESQLTCYSLESMHVEGIGHALQSASTIRTLCLRNEQMAPLQDLITLPNLTSLFFQFRHYHSSPSLLDSLSLPSLQELVICGDHKDILTTSFSLLTRSAEASPSRKSPLKSLRVSHSTTHVVTSNPGTLLSILELTAGLQYLDIPLPSIEVLARLSKVVQGQVIVPTLTCCKFQIVSAASSTFYTALNELGAARCKRYIETSGLMNCVPVQPLPCLMLEHWGNGEPQDFLERIHQDLEALEGGASLGHQQGSSSTVSPFKLRGQRSSHNRAATSNELWFLITEVLPVKDRANQPISEHYGNKLHISRRQATVLTSRLGKYRVLESPNVSDILMVKRLLSKLLLLYHRLQCTPTKLKLRYSYLGDLESNIEETLKAWRAIVDQHASALRWVQDRTALFYISKPESEYPRRRSSLDSCSSASPSCSLAQEHRSKFEDLCSNVFRSL